MADVSETIIAAVDNLATAYKHGGVPQNTATFYSSWASSDNYDKHLNRSLYRGPEIAANAVAEFFPSTQRPDVRILDVAAGTGFVCQNLKSHGFVHIDALDPSEGMLEKARLKNLYDHYICSYLDSNKLPILDGGMGEGHIPYCGLDQLIRVVKPGGLICVVMREEYLNHSQYAGQLEPHMDKLAEQGQWKLLSRSIVHNYCFDLNGIVYKFQVLAGKREK